MAYVRQFPTSEADVWWYRVYLPESTNSNSAVNIVDAVDGQAGLATWHAIRWLLTERLRQKNESASSFIALRATWQVVPSSLCAANGQSLRAARKFFTLAPPPIRPSATFLPGGEKGLWWRLRRAVLFVFLHSPPCRSSSLGSASTLRSCSEHFFIWKECGADLPLRASFHLGWYANSPSLTLRVPKNAANLTSCIRQTAKSATNAPGSEKPGNRHPQPAKLRKAQHQNAPAANEVVGSRPHLAARKGET